MTTSQHVARSEQTGWQLQENSAEAYEVHLVPLFMAPGAQALVELAGVREGDRVLDVATGTGIVARTSVERVGTIGKVAGVDLNESMLTVARKQARGSTPAIEWRIGDARDLPYQDATFDVAFCQQGLQFFPDRAAALGEMHRVLTPGGRLALSLMRPVAHNPAYPILADAVSRYVGDDARDIMLSPFADLSTAALRDLISGAGFNDVRIMHVIAPARYDSVEDFARLEAASSPLAAAVGSLSGATREAMLGQLQEALDEYVDDDGLLFPASVYVAMAYRS